MADQSDTTNPVEEWRPVAGWPYEISSLGRMRRTQGARGTRMGRVLTPRIGPQGYMMVRISHEGTATAKCIHRLICEAFHGPPPTPKHHAAHNDGTRTNNDPSNLRWATPSENSVDTFRHGTARCGGLPGGCKLTPSDVQEIRGLIASGGSNRRIAKRFGVAHATISAIRLGESWRRLA